MLKDMYRYEERDCRDHSLFTARLATRDEIWRLRSGDEIRVVKDRGANSQPMYRVKVTSVKTWKTRPEIRVRFKYGMYETGEMVFLTGEQDGSPGPGMFVWIVIETDEHKPTD